MDKANRLSEEELEKRNANVGQIPTDGSCYLIVISHVLHRPEVCENCALANFEGRGIHLSSHVPHYIEINFCRFWRTVSKRLWKTDLC